MSIGQTLHEARERAGLSVDEVSERTRIRATVVRAIEADDFALCGGDVYARGHVRAIAAVVAPTAPLWRPSTTWHTTALVPRWVRASRPSGRR